MAPEVGRKPYVKFNLNPSSMSTPNLNDPALTLSLTHPDPYT